MKIFIIISVTVLYLQGCACSTKTNFPNLTEILDNLLNDYDKRVRPFYGVRPLEVGVNIYVLSVSSLSEIDMDFTLDMYFRQFWKDPRLAFNNESTGTEKIEVDHDFAERVWNPDTFFPSEKKAYYHDTPVKNTLMRIL